eukprot:1177823-Prorocentrum_minimum.AAC.5
MKPLDRSEGRSPFRSSRSSYLPRIRSGESIAVCSDPVEKPGTRWGPSIKQPVYWPVLLRFFYAWTPSGPRFRYRIRAYCNTFFVSSFYTRQLGNAWQFKFTDTYGVPRIFSLFFKDAFRNSNELRTPTFNLSYPCPPLKSSL